TNALEKQPLLPRQVSEPSPLLALDNKPSAHVIKPIITGGRPIPGRYPEAEPVQFAGRTFDAGIVNSSVLSDLDGDGTPELILACEWGPIRVYRNGKEITAQLGLEKFVGWWQGVTTGDLDGDGLLDIVASNWGLNSSYGRERIALHYGDFDGNGTMDLFETYWDPQPGRMVQRRDLPYLSAGLPSLRLKFPTHLAYSQTPAESILKEWPNAKKLEANTLASMAFLNRGGKFEAVPLPDQAQWAPAFGVCVADFDGDGNEDIFLSQNFFETRPEEPRLDAGRGLLLHGIGGGTFRPMSGDESGIKIYGEQRACAFADYDGDGRTDLLVGQSRGATQLFHNESGREGLRIRLAGPAEGAVIRLRAGEQFGPARAIQHGDSPVQVMTMRQTPTHVWVRWPGGKTSLSEIPAGAKEIEMKP
ncbi:MAG TPA: FG-GAP-like repeat-containing protein, partial [Candidatus Binatia bacterium]|nr:FG-GAP-like repeat-containing protein [Candidatus Binatia bacterium]